MTLQDSNISFAEYFKRLLAKMLVWESIKHFRSRDIRPRYIDVQKYAVEFATQFSLNNLGGLDEAVRQLIAEWGKDEDGALKDEEKPITSQDMVQLWRIYVKTVDQLAPPLSSPTYGEEAILLGRLAVATHVLETRDVVSIRNLINSILSGEDKPGLAEFAAASALSIILYRAKEPANLRDLDAIVEEAKKMEYGLRRGSYVFWRGSRTDGLETAPPGPDIVCLLLSHAALLVEVTLRMSVSQWQAEVEPLWRHTEMLEEKLKDAGVTRVYSLLLVKELRDDTFQRLMEIAPNQNISVLEFRNLIEIIDVLPLAQIVHHADFEQLIKDVRIKPKPKKPVLSAEEYRRLVDDEVRSHSSKWVEKSLQQLLTIKAYKTLLERGGKARIDDIIQALTYDETIQKALRFLGKISGPETTNEKILKKKVDNLFRRYYSIPSMMKSYRLIIDSPNEELIAAPLDEAVNSILNMVGWLSTLEEARKTNSSIGGGGLRETSSM